MKKEKVILITGASRGIGQCTAEELAKRGHCVFATMRNPQLYHNRPLNLIIKHLDVTVPESIQSTVEEILREKGRIDVVINSAGYGLLSPVELAREQEIYDLFNVNFFGAIRVIQSVVPSMQERRSGHLINLSSLSGIAHHPFLGIYCATKHGLETVSASMAVTLSPWNIKVSVVEPGSTATRFGEVMASGERMDEVPIYEEMAKPYRKRLSSLAVEGQSAGEVAQLIASIVESKNPEFRYQTSLKGEEAVRKILVDPSEKEWLKKQIESLALDTKLG